MKKTQLLSLSLSLFMMTAMTACSNDSFDRNNSLSTVTDAASVSSTAECDSLSIMNTSSENDNNQKLCIQLVHNPCAPYDNSRKCTVTDETIINDITEWIDDTKAMLSNEYIVEITDTNSMHSALEEYTISNDPDCLSTPRDEYFYSITVDDIDGYNFSYKHTLYNIPKEHIDKIIEIIEPVLNEHEKKSYVFICRDTTRWELTDEQTTAYIDDFVNNYIPQFNEIGEYDRSEIRNGVDFGSVYLENIQLHVRLVSDNIYNIGILDTSKDVSDEGYEKLYLIPHEKLEELIETINAAKP